MATDNDIKKHAEDCYAAGQAHWSQYWIEAQRDLKFREGDQYTAKDKAYLKSQDRESLVFNKSHRIVNVITGYEQKNLLSLKVDPFEGADEQTAKQLSSLVMNNMVFGGGYMAMSGAFEFGSVVTGMNLVEPWVDRSEDLLNGDIRFRRLPYNRFVLDPTFTDRDLDRDCRFIYTRDFFSKEQLMGMIPDRADDIKRLKGGSSDQKFGYYYPIKGKGNEYNLKYDRFYVSVQRPYQLLADIQTGKIMPLKTGDPKSEQVTKLFMQRFPQLKLIKGFQRGVDLHILIEGQLMYSGLDPSGLDEYPFVLEAGYWTPEEDDPKYRMQGVVRCLRDPGTEVNRRRSMILDMLDGIIRSGWKVKSGSVVNPDELYGSGFSVLWMKETAQLTDAERLSAPAIPEGLFRAAEMFDKDHDEVSGVNSEMLGSAESNDIEVAAVLSKLRSANGLTTLQSLFNGHRFAKTLIGRKQIRMIQKNYTPTKVQRILNEQPTKEFYTGDFGKYDAVPCEGILTDTQRQMYYTQLAGWKKAGAPIPWSELIEYAPLEKKDSLKKSMAAVEQSQLKQTQQDQQIQQITAQLLNAQKVQALATGKEKIAKIQGTLSQADLDRAKTMKELQSIDIDNFERTLTLLMTMAKMLSASQTTQPTEQLQMVGNA